jgi:hypothetical protein
MGTGGRGDKLGRERLWLIVLWRVEVTVETTTTGSRRGQGDLNKLLPGGEEEQQRGGGRPLVGWRVAVRVDGGRPVRKKGTTRWRTTGGGRSTGWRVAGEVEGGRSTGKKGMTGRGRLAGWREVNRWLFLLVEREERDEECI